MSLILVAAYCRSITSVLYRYNSIPYLRSKMTHSKLSPIIRYVRAGQAPQAVQTKDGGRRVRLNPRVVPLDRGSRQLYSGSRHLYSGSRQLYIGSRLLWQIQRAPSDLETPPGSSHLKWPLDTTSGSTTLGSSAVIDYCLCRADCGQPPPPPQQLFNVKSSIFLGEAAWLRPGFLVTLCFRLSYFFVVFVVIFLDLISNYIPLLCIHTTRAQLVAKSFKYFT